MKTTLMLPIKKSNSKTQSEKMVEIWEECVSLIAENLRKVHQIQNNENINIFKIEYI